MKNKLDKSVGQEAIKMKSQPNLTQQKSGIYQFRFIIPQDVQHVFNQKVIKQSLKTGNKREAMIKASQLRTEWLQKVSDARRITEDGTNQVFITESGRVIDLRTQKIDSISEENIKKIANSYLRSLLGYDEDFRTDLKFDVKSRIEITDNFIQSSQNELIKKAVSFGADIELFYPMIAPFVESVCKIDFYNLNEETKLKITRECLKTYQAAGKFSLDRNESWIELDSIAPEYPTYKPNSNLWDEIFDDWEKTKIARPEKTINSFKHSFNEFKKFCNNKSLEELKPSDVIEYRKFFIERIEGGLMKRDTANNKLAHLSAIFSLAKSNEKIDKNVFDGRASIASSRKTDDDAKDNKTPFTAVELRSIFSSNVFLDMESKNAWSKKTNCWLIAIAYATGARSEEIAQLRTEDLLKENNIYYFNISDRDSDGKNVGSIKNKSSIRKIPVHKTLLEAGIVEFFEEQKQAGHFYLFNDLKANKYGRRYASWGNWFNRFIKKELNIQITTFYSFRNTFADACRMASVGDPVMNKIMGHVNENNRMGDKYGHGETLEFLNEKVQTIKFLYPLPKI